MQSLIINNHRGPQHTHFIFSEYSQGYAYFPSPSNSIEFQTTHIPERKWAKQCDSFCFVGYRPHKPQDHSKLTPFYSFPTTAVPLRPLVTREGTDQQTIYIITHQTGPSQCRRPQRGEEMVGHPSAQEPLVRNNMLAAGLRNEGCKNLNRQMESRSGMHKKAGHHGVILMEILSILVQR